MGGDVCVMLCDVVLMGERCVFTEPGRKGAVAFWGVFLWVMAGIAFLFFPLVDRSGCLSVRQRHAADILHWVGVVCCFFVLRLYLRCYPSKGALRRALRIFLWEEDHVDCARVHERIPRIIMIGPSGPLPLPPLLRSSSRPW